MFPPINYYITSKSLALQNLTFGEKHTMLPTWAEGQRQCDCFGVSQGQQVLVAGQNRELLEALAGAPDRKIIRSIISLLWLIEKNHQGIFRSVQTNFHNDDVFNLPLLQVHRKSLPLW